MHAFLERAEEHRIFDFDPHGADERNYCSPGYNLPVCALMRSFYDESEVYHTSDDNLDFISARNIIGAFEYCLKVVNILKLKRTWCNTAQFGEPFFSRHGLAPTISKPNTTHNEQLLARRWIMNQADGKRDLIAISERSSLPFSVLAEQAVALSEAELLKLVQ